MAGVKIVAIMARLPQLTHEQFVTRYEEGHVPLIRRLLPPFGSYRRNFIADPAVRERLGFDVITEAWFPDADAHAAVMAAMADPAISSAIAADEAAFMDRSCTIVFAADERS